MTTRPADLPIEIDRPLNEQEKSLLCWLAIQTVATQVDADEQAVADVLDEIAGRGEVVLKANALLAALFFDGNPVPFTVATREWLAFACMWSQEQPED